MAHVQGAVAVLRELEALEEGEGGREGGREGTHATGRLLLAKLLHKRIKDGTEAEKRYDMLLYLPTTCFYIARQRAAVAASQMRLYLPTICCCILLRQDNVPQRENEVEAGLLLTEREWRNRV